MSDAAKRLRGEREAVARGRLSFDRDEARDKMRMFRLADPHFYVLQFVRAASVLGANRIEFELGTNRMVCTFDKQIDTRQFDDFWGSVFEARSTPMERALHNIALGVSSAQALKPKEIRVQSGRREMVFKDNGEQVWEIAELAGTRIEMTEKFRFGHLLEFLTDHAEADALRDYCRYSNMLVFVDGECVQSAEGEFRTDFKARDEAGFVALRSHGGYSHTTFYFLRDDVLVRTHNIEPQLHPGIGALSSRTLRTDLSGLELASDETLDHLLYDKLYAAYHTALSRWLATVRGVDHLMIGATIFRHIERVRRMNFEPPPATRELAEWWLDQPGFSPANGGELVALSARSAQHEGVIVYSSRRFEQRLGGYADVLFANSSAIQGLMGQLEAAGHPTRDVTMELSLAARAARNRAVWEKQPLRETGHSPIVRTVTDGDATGVLLAPFAPTGRVEPLMCEFTTYAQGRRLTRQPTRVPIGMLVDGPLEVDAMFQDVVRDRQFRRLATKLAGQIPHFVREVLKYVIEPPVHEEQLAAGFELLQGYLSGALPQAIADVFRLPVAEIASEQLEVASEINRLTLLDRLGEIADLPLYHTLRGEGRSLRDLYLREQPPVVFGRRMLLVDRTAELLDQMGYDVFQVSPRQAAILQHIRIDARDESFVTQVAAEARYLERPVFEPPSQHVLAQASHRWVQSEGTFDIDVELLGDGEQCEILFIFRDRLLAQRSWPSPAGRFRVLVHCEHLTPTSDYRDVTEDTLVDEIYQGGQSLVRDVLSSWCMDARKAESLEPGAFRLLWNASVEWAKDEPHAPTLSAWRWSDDWRRVAMSLDQLGAIVERDGGVVHVLRGQGEPPADAPRDTVILPGPADANVELLLSARVAEIGAPIREQSRIEFMSRPMVTPEIPEALFTWRGELAQMKLVVGLMGDSMASMFGHENVIDVLHEGRALEQISEWVPFGDFRTLVQGESIHPDADFTFAGSGRGDAIRAAQLGVVELLNDVCRELEDLRNGELGELEPVRRNLLALLGGSCQRHEPAPPFDVGALLRRTPLYQMTSGGRVSFDELEEVAFEGVIPFVTESSDANALVVEEAMLPVVEDSFADHYRLMTHDALSTILGIPQVGAETVESLRDTREEVVMPSLLGDPLLDALMAVLQRASAATRVLPESVLFGMRWADDLDRLCDVQLDGIRVQRGHALVEFYRRDPSDATRLLVLASVIGSSVNRQLRVFTDAHELELQAALIAPGT